MRASRHVRGRGRRQRGMSLLEVAVALGVALIATVSMMQLAAQSAAEIRAKAVADRLAQVSLAARNYVRTHYVQVLAAAGPHGGGDTLVIPVSGPGPAGLPSLQGGGFLPSTYLDLNSFNQQHAVLIRETSANHLDVLIATYGGQPIKDADLGRIAAKVGAEGGFIMEQPTKPALAGQVQGAYGGWRTPVATWSNPIVPLEFGHAMAALGFDNGTVLSDYLYRYDIGVPEANRMQTSIDMNGNDLNNTRQLDVERIVNDIGDVQVNDNLHVTGTATVEQKLTAKLDAEVGQDLTVKRDATVEGSGTVAQNLTVKGWGKVERDMSVSQTLVVGLSANAGIDVTAGRDVLAQNNVKGADVYSNVKGRTLAQAVQDAKIVAPYAPVDKPTCPGGQTPQVFVSPVAYSAMNGRPVYAVQAYAVDQGPTWQARLTVWTEDPAGTGYIAYDMTAPYAQLMVFSKCT